MPEGGPGANNTLAATKPRRKRVMRIGGRMSLTKTTQTKKDDDEDRDRGTRPARWSGRRHRHGAGGRARGHAGDGNRTPRGLATWSLGALSGAYLEPWAVYLAPCPRGRPATTRRPAGSARSIAARCAHLAGDSTLATGDNYRATAALPTPIFVEPHRRGWRCEFITKRRLHIHT